MFFSICHRCQFSESDSFLICAKIQPSWSSIFDIAFEFLTSYPEPDISLIILGSFWWSPVKLTSARKLFLSYFLITGKTNSYILEERMSANSYFYRIWEPLIKYLAAWNWKKIYIFTWYQANVKDCWWVKMYRDFWAG